MKRSYTLLVLVPILYSSVSAQCGIMPNAMAGITLAASATSTNNRSAMAYNPLHDLYYSVNAGSADYLVDTYAGGGDLVSSVVQGFDYRGLWFDAATSQLEGNGYNNLGIFVQNLDASGIPMGNGTVMLSGTQPEEQSTGDLDPDANEIIYFYSGSIFRYSHATNVLLGSYAVTGLPVGLSSLNSTTVVYVGCPGHEIGLYNYVDRQVLFVDKSTGAYAGSSQLPIAAPQRDYLGMSYANGLFWLYDNLVWHSYQVASMNVSVAEEAATSLLSVHPNPATRMLTVQSTTAPLRMQVLDLSGHEVLVPMQREGNASTLDVQALPAGIYMLRVISAAGVRTARFIKAE